jgi:trehalose/maltose hydrolase-like predicted phosphorylase
MVIKRAMYPWESDDGEEATPTWALTGILSNILLQMFRSLSGTTMHTQDKIG